MLCLLQCFWLKSLINKFHNCRTRSITGTLKAYLLGPYRPNPLPISHFFPLGSPFYPFLPYRVPCQHFSPLYCPPSSPFPPSKAPLLPLPPLLGSSSSFSPLFGPLSPRCSLETVPLHPLSLTFFTMQEKYLSQNLSLPHTYNPKKMPKMWCGGGPSALKYLRPPISYHDKDTLLKTTQKLCAACQRWHLFWLAPFCESWALDGIPSRTGKFLWKVGNLL